MRNIQKKSPSVYLSCKLYSRLMNSLPEENRTKEAVLGLLHQIALQAIEQYEQLLQTETRIIDEAIQNHIDLQVEKHAEANFKTNQEVFRNERRDSSALRETTHPSKRTRQ